MPGYDPAYVDTICFVIAKSVALERIEERFTPLVLLCRRLGRAMRIGANRWLWLVLCLLPIVNFFTLYIFMFLVLGRMLDRLES